jgi:anti-sigma factor RsiW
MNEELEFLISQYADGTLGEEASRALEARLAEDAEARALLAEHRRMIGVLRDMPMPAVAWDRLAARIGSTIAAAPEPGEAEAPASYRLFAGRFAWAAVGLAASVLIAAGLSLRIFLGGHARQSPAGPGTIALERIIHVTGPRAQVAEGPATVDVSIGPGKGLAERGPNIYGDVVSRPSSVLVASGAPATDDTTPQLPF